MKPIARTHALPDFQDPALFVVFRVLHRLPRYTPCDQLVRATVMTDDIARSNYWALSHSHQLRGHSYYQPLHEPNSHSNGRFHFNRHPKPHTSWRLPMRCHHPVVCTQRPVGLGHTARVLLHLTTNPAFLGIGGVLIDSSDPQ